MMCIKKFLNLTFSKKNRGVEWLTKAGSKASKTGTPYYARKQINFHANEPYEATSEEGAFWNSITRIFLQDYWFENLVCNKYPEYFSIRFGDLMQEPDF
jgi:hypothetical protein